MRANQRRFFSFLRNEAPQRYFAWIQSVILGLLLLCILYSLLFALHQFSLSFDSSALQTSASGFLEFVFRSLFWRVTLIFLAGFLVNAFVVLIFLHRLTGPLVRVEQVLRRVGEGVLPSGAVRFRRGDFLDDTCEALNRMLISCRGMLEGLEWRKQVIDQGDSST